MGELRDRMVRDMDVHNFSGRTVEAYVAGVAGLAKYYRRPPNQLSDEEVQRYLLYFRDEHQLSSSTRNQIRCALKFLYEITVRRPQASLAVPPYARDHGGAAPRLAGDRTLSHRRAGRPPPAV